MAPPSLDVPAWATWATLAAILLAAAVGAALGGLLRRMRGPDRLPLAGHIAEARRRLVRMVAAVGLGLAVAFLLRIERTPPWVAVDPYDNLAAQVFRRMAADLVPPDVQLVVTRPTDAFVALFDVALGLAFLLTLPYLLAQLGGFVWPALRERERAFLRRLLVPACGLFVLGAAFAYLVVLPTTFRALYGFATVLGAANLLDVGEFVAFTLLLMALAGAAFQTPLVMYGAARAGLATPGAYLRFWRHAVVAIVVVAALVTPDPTPVSQVLVAVPLVGLYFTGVAVSFAARRAYLGANPGAG